MINVKEYHSFEEVENKKQEWDHFTISCKSPVYMSFDWCRTWWDFYGLKKDLSIYLFYNNKEIIGILPIYFEKVRAFPIWIKIGKIIGANIPPKVFNPPIRAEFIDLVLEAFFYDIFTYNKCDILSFGPISKDYIAYNSISTTENKTKNLCSKITENNYDPYIQFFLPGQFQDYLNSLTRSERRNYKNGFKYLNQTQTVTFDLIKDFDKNGKQFNDFLKMHFNQWQEKRKFGHFRSWPNGESFNKVLSMKQSKMKRFRLLNIKIDNEVVYYIYGFKYGDRFFAQISARTIKSNYKKISLGRIGLIKMFEALISEGVKNIEAGLGYYDYKIKLGGQMFPTSIFRFTANSISSRIRSSIIRVIYYLLSILYHKIWYRRIQSHLPKILQRPIWKYWIKLHY